jgi:hypothetical protein
MVMFPNMENQLCDEIVNLNLRNPVSGVLDEKRPPGLTGRALTCLFGIARGL